MLIEIDNISKTYEVAAGEVRALESVSVQADGGEFVSVRGPSGCGKSTLLLAAGGLLAPDAGTVRVNGEDVYKLTPNGRARMRASAIGFVFQQFHLIPYLTVLENVQASSLAKPSADSEKGARELIERFGLTDRIAHVPAELSTGERQRTALARALLNSPKVLLADEPTGNLDEDNAQTVLKALREFADAGGAVLLVTHGGHAEGFIDRTVRLDSGRVVTEAE